MINLNEYNEIMNKLKGAIKKYNKPGDVDIHYDICEEYGFTQISRTVLDKYIVFYVIYGLTEEEGVEYNIILKENDSPGYIFTFRGDLIIKLKNTEAIDYNNMTHEDSDKYFKYYEKGKLNRDKELIEKAYNILDKYFK